MTETGTNSSSLSFEQTMRGWGTTLLLWRLCGHASCRRARACRGKVRLCVPRNFPLLPEGVRGWFAAVTEAKEEGMSFEEMRDWLDGTEEDEAFREWALAVKASVMGYTSPLSKRR